VHVNDVIIFELHVTQITLPQYLSVTLTDRRTGQTDDLPRQYRAMHRAVKTEEYRENVHKNSRKQMDNDSVTDKTTKWQDCKL